MDWTEKHYLCLACEIRASDIFKSTKKKTVQRAQVRKLIADTLCSYDTPTFTVSKCAVRDRYGIISSKYKKKLSTKERASGIEVEQTELKVLLEELIEQEDLSDEEGNEA